MNHIMKRKGNSLVIVITNPLLYIHCLRLKEEANYRSMRRKIRAQDLLEKSRSPFTSKQSKSLRRSKSATDLAALVNDGYAFRPKTNGYYVPDFEKLHSRITRTFEQSKRERSPIKCKPFLLYTNMIPSKKDKIIQDILHDAELKHAKSLEIKGKPMNSKRVPVTSLSVSLQQHEAIPTKMTNAQRLRESKTKKQLFEEAKSMRYQEDAQRSKSLTEKKVRQHMHERTKLQEQMIVAKAERNEKVQLSSLLLNRLIILFLDPQCSSNDASARRIICTTIGNHEKKSTTEIIIDGTRYEKEGGSSIGEKNKTCYELGSSNRARFDRRAEQKFVTPDR